MVFKNRVLVALFCVFMQAKSVSLWKRASVYNIPGDPPYTVPEAQLSAAINCTSGNTNPKIALIVPGTAAQAEQAYGLNLGLLLPANGYPVCYLNTPDNSLIDAQITSEYVAYAINSLASSTGNPIRVVTHSQGGLNTQWALTFWPSTRASVFSFFAIAPDYRGSIVLDATRIQLAAGVPQNAAAVQQGYGSNFVTALAAHDGLTAHVPTTDIYTLTDELVQPELLLNATSALSGSNATNVAVQSVCPTVNPDHITIIITGVTEYLLLMAFGAANGRADPSSIPLTDRTQLCLDILPHFNSVAGAVSIGFQTLVAVFTTFTTVTDPQSAVTAEPPLMPYAQ
ncbi:Lipase B-like protein [Mycena sanguinolenta]|uniref:Lipase B-like protein n=1 Tax=Mycena sanguinolenta TaxID=230812 RepID=A0A8H6Y2P2_9AGAR|nr:Lipase B-like protein [Mycena sanguinolenta]